MCRNNVFGNQYRRFRISTENKEDQGKDAALKLSEIQDLQLKVIGHTNWNDLNGEELENLLRQNCHLWQSVMMPSYQLYPLIEMKKSGIWTADTLYIFVQEGKESELETLANGQFHADEIKWIDSNRSLELLGYWKKDMVYNAKMILSVWWD